MDGTDSLDPRMLTGKPDDLVAVYQAFPQSHLHRL